MERKYIEKMNKEELTQVFNSNEKLRNDVYEDMVDCEMYWVSEKLDYIKDSLSDWSIGVCNHNYIRVNNKTKFINGLLKMDDEMPLFSDEDVKQLHDVVKLRDAFYNMEFDNEHYNEAEEAYEEAVDELADEVARQFGKWLDSLSDRDNMLSYFLEFYAEERIDSGTMYIEDDTYELFKDVSYIKSFK